MTLSGVDRGAGGRLAAGATTWDPRPTSNFDVGSMASLGVIYDNSATAGADPFVSITDPHNTWVLKEYQLNDPGTPNAGLVFRIYTCLVVNLTTSTGPTITVSPTSTAQAFVFDQVSSTLGYPSVRASSSSTAQASNPSITSAALVTGEMIIGMLGTQANGTYLADTDTLNGAWSSPQQKGSAGHGTSAANQQIQSQRKVVTGNGAQTYNLTSGVIFWAIGYLIIEEVAIIGGKPKVWNGSAWVAKPVKYWTGSAWVEKPMKYWNGSAWVLV